MTYPKAVLIEPVKKTANTVSILKNKTVNVRKRKEEFYDGFIQVRNLSNLDGIAFFLDTDSFDWTLALDDQKQLVLIPTKK